MNIYVDDEQVDAATVGDGTLEEALHNIQNGVCAPDRLVVDVRIDGHDVPEGAMAEALKKPATTFGRIDISTGTRQELVVDAMDQATTCLAETMNVCREIADLLAKGDTVQATQDLGKCLRVWQQIHEAIGKSIEMLQVDLEQLTIDNEPLTEVFQKPIKALQQIKEALLAKDFVLLADILQYEFDEVADCWQALINALKLEATEAQPAHPQ